jgi:hypothetical protein
VVQAVGADGDPDGDFIPGAVIADLELKGVVQAPLEVPGQPGKAKRELRQGCEQAGVGRAGLVLLLGELGEFVGLGAVLGDQLAEPMLDGLPVLAGSVGIFASVSADGLSFEFGDQGALAPFDVADRLAQCAGALGGAVCCFCGGGVAGELGGQQLAAIRAEDALGEEAVHDIGQADSASSSGVMAQ